MSPAVIAETSPLASASTLVGVGGKDLEWWTRRLIEPGASPQPVFDCLWLRQNKLTVKSGYISWLGKYNPFQWLNDDSFKSQWSDYIRNSIRPITCHAY